MQRADERNTWTSRRAPSSRPRRAPVAVSAEERAARQSKSQEGLYTTFGEGWQRAFEIAVIPVLFGLAGWWLDRRLGWMPVLTVLFVAYAVVGTGARMWFTYDARMKAEEEGRPWGGGS